MIRLTLAVILLASCVAWPAAADDLDGRTGLGLQLGIQKLVGDDVDYSNVDQNFGLWLRHGFSLHGSYELGLNYGYVRPGALIGEDAGFTFDSVHAYYTTMATAYVGLRFHFAPEARFGPYVGTHIGLMNWRVRDHNDKDAGVFPDGTTVSGFDEDGNIVKLNSTDPVWSFTLGTEIFLSESVSMDLGARYALLMSNDLDNIGSSVIWQPSEADVNTARWDLFMGVTRYFGSSSDKDGDGIANKYDGCPDAAEDIDGYRDEDGCPDPDNDNDGVLDTKDLCPDDAEDRDGYRDEDGCPDPDNDGDGVVDALDACPEQAEDQDGFQDDDGCPDLDDDQDGVPDTNDKCPGTPAGVIVGIDGCPTVREIQAEMVLEGVSFATNSADLTVASYSVLNKVADSLAAFPAVNVEIQGHTDRTGSAAYNLDISGRRAEAVRDYLIAQGIAPARLRAVGYGETRPIASNDSREGRAANRRVEVVRLN